MILCGGLGKRLRPVTETVPKPLVEIKDNYSILDKQLFDFKNAGVTDIYLLAGFLHEKIEERYGTEYNGMDIHYIIEDEPLGTLNAIRLGMEAIKDDGCQFVIRNGDIVSDFNLKRMIEYGEKSALPLTMFVTQLQSPYGIVELNGDKITSFKEKPILEDYYINGEIELTNSKLIDNKDAIYKQIIAQVASTLSKNIDELVDFFEKTLYGYQMANNPSMSLFASDSLTWELEAAIQFLLKNGIIRATPEGLKTTEFGNLIAKSNYEVKTAVKIKEYISSSDELNIAEFIYMLSETPDLPLITFKGRKSKEPVREKMSELGLFAVDIGNPEATTVSLIEWINERDEFEIENRYSVYSASTRRTAYDASKLVRFAKNTAEILGKYSNLQEYDYLSARLYYGVKEDIIPLVVGVKRLGRKRARNIVQIFGTDLKSVSEKELRKIDGVGEKLSEKIKKFAEGS